MNKHHSDFIEYYFNFFSYKSYLELGLYEGETIDKIKKHTKEVYGVDLIDRSFNDINFFKCSTDEFFDKNTKTFDTIFVDADHEYGSVKKDFNNSLKVLNAGGTIFLHDTDPREQRLINKGYCGDSYKIIEYLEELDGVEAITLPVTEAGLTLVKRNTDRRVLSL